MMILIEDYIKESKEERQKHLRLNEFCIERGGNSVTSRGLLAYFLNTTILKGSKIQLCHACLNNKCSNPYHLYWGTSKENRNDSPQLTIWERSVNKYGLEEAKSIWSKKNNALMAKRRAATDLKSVG